MVRTTEKFRQLLTNNNREESKQRFLDSKPINSVLVESGSDYKLIKKKFDFLNCKIKTISQVDGLKKGKYGIFEHLRIHNENEEKQNHFFGFVDMDHEFDLKELSKEKGIHNHKILDTKTSCCLFMMVTKAFYEVSGWEKVFNILKRSNSSIIVHNLNDAKDKLKEHWNEILSISEEFTWNKLYRANSTIKITPPIRRKNDGSYIANNLEEVKNKLTEFKLQNKNINYYIEKHKNMLGSQYNDHEFAFILYHWINSHPDLFSFNSKCKSPKDLENILVENIELNKTHELCVEDKVLLLKKRLNYI